MIRCFLFALTLQLRKMPNLFLSCSLLSPANVSYGLERNCLVNLSNESKPRYQLRENSPKLLEQSSSLSNDP